MKTNAHPALAGLGTNGWQKADTLAYLTAAYLGGGTGLYIDANDLLIGDRVVTRLLPEAQTQPRIIPRSIICHTNAATGTAKTGTASIEGSYNWWNRVGNGGESHLQFTLGGQASPNEPAMVGQFMPFSRRADCNADANAWTYGGWTFGAISHETQDWGTSAPQGSINVQPWTLAQFQLLAAVTAVECVTYQIHCTQPARWTDSGIGHHSLFPWLGTVGAGSWTNVRGKTCPGRARIAQMDELRRQVTGIVADFYMFAGGACPA